MRQQSASIANVSPRAWILKWVFQWKSHQACSQGCFALGTILLGLRYEWIGMNANCLWTCREHANLFVGIHEAYLQERPYHNAFPELNRFSLLACCTVCKYRVSTVTHSAHHNLHVQSILLRAFQCWSLIKLMVKLISKTPEEWKRTEKERYLFLLLFKERAYEPDLTIVGRQNCTTFYTFWSHQHLIWSAKKAFQFATHTIQSQSTDHRQLCSNQR